MIQIISVVYVVALLLKLRLKNVTKFVQNVYCAYLGINLGDQDKTWAPHKICPSFVLNHCVDGTIESKKNFAIWHPDDVENAKDTCK